jgi:hypothetical protein
MKRVFLCVSVVEQRVSCCYSPASAAVAVVVVVVLAVVVIVPLADGITTGPNVCPLSLLTLMTA